MKEKNKKFFDEIISFLASGSILKPDGLIPFANVRYIYDFDEAEELATAQECDHCELSWVELRADKSMKLLSVAREKNSDLYNYVMNDLEEYRTIVNRAFYKRSLKGDLSDEAVEIGGELQADLFDCLVDRVVHGESSKFYSALFQFYTHGLWVCGWEGDIPSQGCSNGTWLIFKMQGS